jgi:hypothetical protein
MNAHQPEMTMQTINHNSTHFVGAPRSLAAGRFDSQHRGLKAALSAAAWLRNNSSLHRKEGCEVWTREQIEAARALV